MYWMSSGDVYEKCVDNPKVVAIRIESYPPFNFHYTYNDDDDEVIKISKYILTLPDAETINTVSTDKGVVYNLNMMRNDLSKISTLKNNYSYR